MIVFLMEEFRISTAWHCIEMPLREGWHNANLIVVVILNLVGSNQAERGPVNQRKETPEMVYLLREEHCNTIII